ncbi:hypothetical protein SAMN04515672_2973 [Natronorubrum texcoconense]|uniref:Uncharacterized protein n=1 Tax=Natronorubrum texcoconense TaxID=1095776 RepID=A0A1G9BKB8_9EURY|nr:hypothetical protein SAMN04515672_2973 [Natronorubrum texcoconense]
MVSDSNGLAIFTVSTGNGCSYRRCFEPYNRPVDERYAEINRTTIRDGTDHSGSVKPPREFEATRQRGPAFR